jgi:hypothetical protein
MEDFHDAGCVTSTKIMWAWWQLRQELVQVQPSPVDKSKVLFPVWITCMHKRIVSLKLVNVVSPSHSTKGPVPQLILLITNKIEVDDSGDKHDIT